MVKLLLNSVISTLYETFMTLDIKTFHLKTPMQGYKYLRLKISTLPDKVIKEYNLKAKVTHDGPVYVEICRIMYSFRYAGLIAQELLEKLSEKYGYV